MEDAPSIVVGPLKIWIADYQYPDAQDYDDANWVFATARCEGCGSRVEATGAFIHLSELKKWKEDLMTFQCTLKGRVDLPTMEPTLTIKIEGQKSNTGQLNCEVCLTGEHLRELHRYSLDIDQSYLPTLLAQVAAVLREFPIRNERTD